MIFKVFEFLSLSTGSHCWRYDIDSRLGRFLHRPRLSEKVYKFLYEEAKALLQNQLLDELIQFEGEAVHLYVLNEEGGAEALIGEAEA